MLDVPQPDGRSHAERPAGGPTIHGTYDYWLGGSQHLRADRELAQAIAAKYPSVPSHIRAAQDFHLRAARWCAQQGISRFIRAGHFTALPAARSVHHVVREVIPDAEVVYAYRDDVAHALSAGLLAGERGATAARSGDGGILALAPVREMLAAGEPVCVIAGLLFHFVPAERAAAKIASVAGALPPGSALVVSMALAADSPRARDLLAMFTPAEVYRHSADDLACWLKDAGLAIVEPGVMDVRVVPGPGPFGRLPAAAPGFIGGAVARKP